MCYVILLPFNDFMHVGVFQGPQHQSFSPALCCQHMEGGPAEQKEALCGPLLSFLHTTELGKVTPQIINSNMSSFDKVHVGA